MILVTLYALVAAAIALITGPIPGTSLLLTGLEVLMIWHIARRHGCQLAREIGLVAVLLYAGIALARIVVSMLSGLLPVVGWFIAKPAIAFLSMAAWGALSTAYFKGRGQLGELGEPAQRASDRAAR